MTEKPIHGRQEPPFSIDLLNRATEDGRDGLGVLPDLESLLPASYRGADYGLEPTSLSLHYLSDELGLQSLESFNQWFWLLSSPSLPRPLHDCAFLGRQIYITEHMDRHLGLSKNNDLFLKPVPRVLLDLRFWRDFLPCRAGCPCAPPPPGTTPILLQQESSTTSSSSPEEANAADGPKCEHRQLWECALGFLYSYAALISHESDFRLARSHNLLPGEVTWPAWRRFAQQVARYPQVHARMHKRFLYGELRLHRVKEMSQLRHGGLLPVIVGRLDRFARFFRNNVQWLASLVAYMAIVLTALQVGTATDGLMDDDAFQSFSYGFTVFSLVGPLAVMVGFALYFGFYLGYYLLVNLVSTNKAERIRRKERKKLNSHSRV